MQHHASHKGTDLAISVQIDKMNNQMIRSLLILSVFMVFFTSLKAQEKCPIKLLNIDILNKKELQQDYQICVNTDSIELICSGDTIMFINNFYGAIGNCLFPIRYLNYGKTNKDYFISVSYFKIIKNSTEKINFEMTYRKVNKITFLFMGDELSAPVTIDKKRVLGLLDKRLLQSLKI